MTVEPKSSRQMFALAALVASCTAVVACTRGETSEHEPIIAFTQVPQWSSGDENVRDVIEGNVHGSRPGQRMVLYSKCADRWWLQPLLAYPYTSILPNQQWRNEVHLGTEYAALLVDESYRPDPVLRSLPERGGAILQIAIAHGQQKSSSFFVEFSGFKWRVRRQPSNRGGSNNLYHPGNVFIDGKGAMHLSIVKRNGHWTCSEVNLTRNLGYGTYSFIVEDVAHLEPSVVFAIFSWDYSTHEQNNREFDINFSLWGGRFHRDAEFTLQPSSLPSNVSRFEAPAGKLKHIIVWEPGRITMTTGRADASSGAPPTSKRVFSSEVPAPGLESIRMAVYLYTDSKTAAPGLDHATEIVVDRFQFLP